MLLNRSPLASEDALGALRASSRLTNTGLEVHVQEGYVSTFVRTSEDVLRAHEREWLLSLSGGYGGGPRSHRAMHMR